MAIKSLKFWKLASKKLVYTFLGSNISVYCKNTKFVDFFSKLEYKVYGKYISKNSKICAIIFDWTKKFETIHLQWQKMWADGWPLVISLKVRFSFLDIVQRKRICIKVLQCQLLMSELMACRLLEKLGDRIMFLSNLNTFCVSNKHWHIGNFLVAKTLMFVYRRKVCFFNHNLRQYIAMVTPLYLHTDSLSSTSQFWNLNFQSVINLEHEVDESFKIDTNSIITKWCC